MTSDGDLSVPHFQPPVASIVGVDAPVPEVIITPPHEEQPDPSTDAVDSVTVTDEPSSASVDVDPAAGNVIAASEETPVDAVDADLGQVDEACECLSVLRGQQDNRMMIVVEVDGHGQEEALIDTGANVSLIHSDLADQYSLQIQPSDCPAVSGFGVGNVNPVKGCCTVTLTVMGVKMEPADFLVIDTLELKKYGVLLATDFLMANHLSIDVPNRKLTYTGADGSIVEHCCRRDSKSCLTKLHNVPCYALSTVTISSGHARVIPVKWNVFTSNSGHADCQRVLYFEELDEGKPFGVPAALVGLDSGTGKVFAINDSAEWCKVKRGELLGTLSSVFPVAWPANSGEVSRSVATAGGSTEPPSIELDQDLIDCEKDIVHRLLREEVAVFSNGDDDIGTLSGSQHQIILYDYSPIYQRPRRFPEVVNAEIEKQCQELYEADIIEPSNSPWSSPVVPVRKKDGSLRLCIDYRKLNAVTVPDKFPLPNLNDAVFGLHGMKYFTSLDMVRGYYQFSLDESSREFTAFSTHRAHWQFKCLTFGLKNAPSVFQREMQKILGEFSWRHVIVYIDDVLILSKTFAEHVDLVRRVLRKLVEHGAKIKGPKCKWFCKQVEFLGHIVSEGGLSKPRSYIDAVANFPRPATVRELREFIGLINFQRKFIPQCSVIMKPLSRLTGQARGAKIKWTGEMVAAFEKLREEVQKDITLAFPDYSKDASPLELYTDASGTGVGACLFQKQGDASRHIAYASLAFSPAEKNYSTLERELAAIRWAVRTFRGFLFGVDFVICTDHRPLVYLHNMQIVNSRLARTIEDLADYTFVIKYSPGKDNIAADILSRRDWSAVTGGASEKDVTCLPPGLVLLESVPGGGDSMVTSLLIAIKHVGFDLEIPDTPWDLRQLLVVELQRDPKRYRLIKSKALHRELELMKYSGQLLCVQALEAFSHLFKCIVLVHYGPVFPVTYSSPFRSLTDLQHRVHLQCLCGVHYNPVVECSTYTVPNLLRSQPEIEEQQLASSCVDMVTDAEDEDDLAGVLTASQAEWCPGHTRTHSASIMVECGERSWCALLDTGAEVNCVSHRVCSLLGVTEFLTSKCTITGIGPHRCQVLGIIELRVGIGNSSLYQNFAVVEDLAMAFCFILGIDFLDRIGMYFNFVTGHIIVGQCAFPVANCSPSVEASCNIVSRDAFRALPSSVRGLNIGPPESLLSFAIEWNSNELLIEIIDRDVIGQLQRRNPQLSSLRRAVGSGQLCSEWPRRLQKFRRYSDSLAVENDLLLFTQANFKSFVVTFSLLVEMVLVFHYKLGHPGRERLINLVREHVWHPSLSAVVADVTRTCATCQHVKVSPTSPSPTLRITTAFPFEMVVADLIALPTTKQRHIGCLVVIDHNSKWLSMTPIKNKTAGTVAMALKRLILPSLLRLPVKLLSDNGPEFRSAEFNAVLQEVGIEHIYSTPYKPSSCGLVERVNRTMTEVLRNLSADPSTWDDYLPSALILYNSTPHTELKMSPSQYLLSKEHLLVSRPLVASQDRSYWKEGNPSFLSFSVGQKVLRRKICRGRLLSDKLAERFTGPFTIIKVNENGVTYLMEDASTGAQVRVHHSQLRKFHEPPSYIVNHPCFLRLQGEQPPVSDADDVDEAPSVRLPEVSYIPGCMIEPGTDSSDNVSSSDSSGYDEVSSQEQSSIACHDFLDMDYSILTADMLYCMLLAECSFSSVREPWDPVAMFFGWDNGAPVLDETRINNWSFSIDDGMLPACGLSSGLESSSDSLTRLFGRLDSVSTPESFSGFTVASNNEHAELAYDELLCGFADCSAGAGDQSSVVAADSFEVSPLVDEQPLSGRGSSDHRAETVGIMDSSPTTSADATEPSYSGPITRSRGPVSDLPWVRDVGL